jgi:hypothetical protein
MTVVAVNVTLARNLNWDISKKFESCLAFLSSAVSLVMYTEQRS